ncbi:hypothetical protein DBR28_01950 [Chryseobacterium sp. HMWF028]|nr:hypothetical protein DBR28_01950 [Chryseobacterium sp. HMWF028]
MSIPAFLSPEKLKRENLKTIKGGNMPLCDMYLVQYNGYYVCCSVPTTNPCELKKKRISGRKRNV